MTKKILRRTCVLAALVLVLASLLTLGVGAASDKSWSISADRTTLTDGHNKYTFYLPPADVYWLPVKTVYYHDVEDIGGIDNENDYVFTLMSVGSDTEILYLESTFAHGFYVTDAQREALAAFEREESIEYRILRSDNAYMQGTLTEETIRSLKALGNSQETEVRTLQSLPSYKVVYYDSTGSLYRQIGILFFFENGSVGYVNYAHLSNAHFDADGNFSFRSGTAPVCIIEDEQLIADVREATDSVSDYSPLVEYEGDDAYWEWLSRIALPLFWILFAITGALLPCVGLIIGIKEACSRKRKKHVRWYALIGLCCLWLVLTLAIFLILII